jgi:hypothetical protein
MSLCRSWEEQAKVSWPASPSQMLPLSVGESAFLGSARERWRSLAGKSNHRATATETHGSSVRRVGCRRQPDGRTPRSVNTKRARARRLVFADRGVLPRRFAPLAGLDGHVVAARAASNPRRDKNSVASVAPFPRRGGDFHRRALKNWKRCGVDPRLSTVTGAG